MSFVVWVAVQWGEGEWMGELSGADAVCSIIRASLRIRVGTESVEGLSVGVGGMSALAYCKASGGVWRSMGFRRSVVECTISNPARYR